MEHNTPNNSPEEKSFEQIMNETTEAFHGIVAIANYWRGRCEAAEKVIEVSEIPPSNEYLNWASVKHNIPEFI